MPSRKQPNNVLFRQTFAMNASELAGEDWRQIAIERIDLARG
jgi:hypothetical protein